MLWHYVQGSLRGVHGQARRWHGSEPGSVRWRMAVLVLQQRTYRTLPGKKRDTMSALRRFGFSRFVSFNGLGCVSKLLVVVQHRRAMRRYCN